MAFNEGRRDVGLWMLQQIEIERPSIFGIMRSEHQKREERYDAIPEPELKENPDE